MSYIDKQALRERYSPQPVPKCRICGDEMTVQRIYGSHITYGCTGATYDDKGCHYAEGRSIADDHYAQSRVTVVDVSDPDVLALLDENIQLQREKDAIEAVALALRDDMRQARIALASLGAEPVAWTSEGALAEVYCGETGVIGPKYIVGDIPLYRHAQPAPVVPEEKTMPNHLSMYAVDAVAAIAEVRGWNACRAAMLHGAEPVSQTYKSQHTQFEQVSDLYEMQFDDGRTCAFHTDAQKAAQWLQACDGNRVQEYVKLERLRNALSGNYPVTPDGWISCSEQMPVIGELNWRTSFPLLVTCEIGVIPAYYGFVSVNGDRHYGFMESLKYGDDNGNHPQTNEYGLISNVTHWMPLPEPPKEEK